MTLLSQRREELNRRLLQFNTVKSNLEKETTNLEESNSYLASLQEAQEFLQQAAQAIQNKAHQKIASLVTMALTSIFEEDAPKFHIEFERKRGKTEATLLFKKGDLILSPLEASGGGVVDVAAFALRLAAISLAKPRRRSLLLLDEPFRFVSKNYLPKVKSLLENLSNDLNVQIIMVTHLRELQSTTTVELGN